MDVNKQRLTDAVARLKQERDELRLKVHLGTMEAKDEWKELEEKWQTLEARLAESKHEAAAKARKARAKATVVANELEAAYRRIGQALTVD